MKPATFPAGEIEPALASTTDSEILRSFRESLLAVYPVLQRLRCLENDTQPYDDFDHVAEALWEVVVLRTFAWRDGLSRLPQLPPYGFSEVPIGSDGFIEVRPPGLPPLRFIQFIGDRSLGVEPFNAIHGVEPGGKSVRCSFGSGVLFSWVRAA